MNKICHYTIEQYANRLTEYHGHFGPGLLLGGFMVDAAVGKMAQYERFDAICETQLCLPDAVQMLTPCTVGNGRLKVLDTGRFALALYERISGDGVRIGLDVSKLDPYPEIRNWFMRLVSKHDQDKDALMNEILAAGQALLSVRAVQVLPEYRGKHANNRNAICESCGEAYPENERGLCLACQGMALYV